MRREDLGMGEPREFKPQCDEYVFHVFRHGETDWNVEGRFQGHIDIPLNDRGREQAKGLIPKLLPFGLDVILSSDLSRAHETATILAQGLGISVLTDPGLREAYLGHAQGLTYDEILEQFGEDVTGQWRSHLPTDADVSYPGGETGNQVMERVFKTLEDFMRREPSFRKIGISCHGGVIRRIMQRIRPPGGDPVRIPNAVLYQIGYDFGSRAWNLIE